VFVLLFIIGRNIVLLLMFTVSHSHLLLGSEYK